MENMDYIDVREILRDHDVGKVTQYTTHETLVIRLIKHFLDLVPMSLDQYVEMVRTSFYLHPECSNLLQSYIEHVSSPSRVSRPIKLSEQELETVKKVLSSDYHQRRDVEEMADILYNRVLETRDSNMMRNFNFLFAVDGLARGSNFKHYVDHLTIPWRDVCPIGPLRAHVDAVRSLYRLHYLEMTPDKMRKALLKVYKQEEIETDNDPEKERNDIQLLYTKRVWFIEEEARLAILEKKIQRLELNSAGNAEDCKYSKPFHGGGLVESVEGHPSERDAEKKHESLTHDKE